MLGENWCTSDSPNPPRILKFIWAALEVESVKMRPRWIGAPASLGVATTVEMIVWGARAESLGRQEHFIRRMKAHRLINAKRPAGSPPDDALDQHCASLCVPLPRFLVLV